MPQLRLLGPGMLRSILAAMVVVSHLTSLNIGRPAVLLFFMLSGYWVSRLLAGWQASVPAFYASRTLRVWPLYAVVTVLAWLLHAHAEAVRPESLWSALTLLGLAARAGDVIGVSWSLDIELQFYLAIPLITLAAQRLQPLALLALAVAAFGPGHRAVCRACAHLALLSAGLPCRLCLPSPALAAQRLPGARQPAGCGGLHRSHDHGACVERAVVQGPIHRQPGAKSGAHGVDPAAGAVCGMEHQPTV